MSDLERAAQPLMRPMLRGQLVSLTRKGQLDMARWFTKTVAIYEFARQRRPTYLRPRDRESFYRARRIPPDTFIFLARYLGDRAVWTRDGDTPLLLKSSSPAQTQMDGYSVTIAIGQLALQLFSFRRPEDTHGAISVKIPGDWDAAHVPIWPVSGDCIWPPPKALDDVGFELFAKRWLTAFR